MNLVNNAIQSRSGLIEISIDVREMAAGELQIKLTDNGPGIEPAVLNNLQEPFFTTKSQGTGLGLAVVRAVVQAHHGQFELRSKLGVGTTAVLTLPLINNTVLDVGEL